MKWRRLPRTRGQRGGNLGVYNTAPAMEATPGNVATRDGLVAFTSNFEWRACTSSSELDRLLHSGEIFLDGQKLTFPFGYSELGHGPQEEC